MVNVNKNITKVCSFYVSDWHFITMLLPHVSKSIDAGVKIATILEKNSQEKVEELLNKVKIPKKEEIINIGWKEKNINEENIKNIINKFETKGEIIISGTNKYIEEVNTIINYYMEENNIQKQIKVINCYFVEENFNVNKVLEKHDLVLNTSGEKTTREFLDTVNF